MFELAKITTKQGKELLILAYGPVTQSKTRTILVDFGESYKLNRYVIYTEIRRDDSMNGIDRIMLSDGMCLTNAKCFKTLKSASITFINRMNSDLEIYQPSSFIGSYTD